MQRVHPTRTELIFLLFLAYFGCKFAVYIKSCVDYHFVKHGLIDVYFVYFTLGLLIYSNLWSMESNLFNLSRSVGNLASKIIESTNGLLLSVRIF